MEKNMGTTYRLFLICLAGSLLFQSCAISPPSRPIYYPPPPPPPDVQQVPTPDIEPVKPPPPRTDLIAAEFSSQAEAQTKLGRLDLAAATLERGLRAAPKNAMLWSHLAEVKLKQQQYQQASSLAAKSNSLAASDTTVIQKNYWIIEEARRRSAGQ